MGYHDTNGRYRATQTKAIELVGGWHLAAGTPLAAFADGDSVTPGLALDNSEFSGIRWNDHATPAAALRRVKVPLDRAPGTDMTVVVDCSKSGATEADATTFTIAGFFSRVGDLHDADTNVGGDTDAIVGTGLRSTRRIRQHRPEGDRPETASRVVQKIAPRCRCRKV
jgi:hypothetical protein